MSDLIRCNKRTKLLLNLKKENSGRSIPDIVEYAVVNMPFIPPKGLYKKKR